MNGLTEIHKLGYMIQSIWQDAPDSWWCCIRSPFEWELWQANGKSFAEATKKAAVIARRRGHALEASKAYRARVAARSTKQRVRLEPKKRRNRL